MTKPANIDPLEIVNKLHSTLDIHEIFKLFCDHLNSQLPFDSLNYDNNQLAAHFSHGAPQTNQFNFNLTIENTELGQILITRKQSFNQDEINLLEEQLCYLIYPLKNAIAHFEALNAALRDPLTQLLNRGSLENTLQRELKLTERQQSPLSIIVIDIDNFKKINDQYGHPNGDNVLIQIAKIITQTIRETDFAFRTGGEEFLIILSDTDSNGSKKLAERLRERVEHSPVNDKAGTISFTISLGLSCYRPGDNQQTIISRADNAMYQAKSAGKNQVMTALE